MKFVDNVNILAVAGTGGNGKIAFLREFARELGGPSGGNGGDGGSVYFVGNHNLKTLSFFQTKTKLQAAHGTNGQRKNQTGKKGNDLFVNVPLGTIVKDKKTNKIIANITIENQEYLICNGGKGGRGNASFKTRNNTAPTLCENGQKGEQRELYLELQLIADVGFLGFPNAGKSTFISQISSAKPKIANYPFTTLSPVLGVVTIHDQDLIFADIPGIIEGASEGKGLGLEFLRHINKCSILLHILDGSLPFETIVQNYEIMQLELMNYSQDLFTKPQLLVINKLDLLDPITQDKLKNYFKTEKNVQEMYFISAIKKQNINSLLTDCLHWVKKYETENVTKNQANFDEIITLSTDDDSFVVRKETNKWVVEGESIKKIFDRIPMISQQNTLRINSILKSKGIFKELIKSGIKEGEHVHIYEFQFQWKG